MRRGGIGLCVATQIARYVKQGNPLPGWHSPEQAWAQTQGQLAWYRAMEERGEMLQSKDTATLEKLEALWKKNSTQNAIGQSQHAERRDPALRGPDPSPSRKA